MAVVILVPFSNAWREVTDSTRRTKHILEIQLEIAAREFYQASYVEAMIAGRSCRVEPPSETFLVQKRKQCLRLSFTAYHDLVGVNNFGYVRLQYGDAEFASETFLVKAMPSVPDTVDSGP